MEKKLSNVLDDIDELTNCIKNSDKYKRYLVVKKSVEENKEIMDKINEVKVNQKEIVKLKHNKKDYKKEEKRIEEILNELEEYPLYTEYNYLVEDLNYELSYIKKTIEKEIDKLLN